MSVVDDLLLAEYDTFRLTNEQRTYFGLNPVPSEWEEVEIKKGTTVYYEGDIIRKVIHYDFFRGFSYTEYDTQLATKDHTSILPRTPRGKEKKLTPTNVLGFMPTGCKLYISLPINDRSIVTAYSPRNNICLPIVNYEHISSVNELIMWLQEYIDTCPDDYFEKVQRMRDLPKRTIKYRVGDVFRFEVDRQQYGFGIIIGELRKAQKHLPNNHPWHSLMTVPILIRLYEHITTNKDMPVSEVVSKKLLDASFMSDNDIIGGTHEIIGHKKIEDDDIDFPMHVSYLRENHGPFVLRFSWGIGTAGLDKELIESEILSITDDDYKRRLDNTGVSLSLPIYQLMRVLNREQQTSEWTDIRHPDNRSKLKKIFELFGFPLDMDIDWFNNNNSGYTRQQYIHLMT